MRTCKANVLHLDENIYALGLVKHRQIKWLANPCIQHRHKVAKCKSHGINVFWIGWSPLRWHYKKWG